MAGALPIVGACTSGGGGAAAAGGSGAKGCDGSAQELAPVCSGVLALRRVTALVSNARSADAQGEYHQARKLYSEVLKVRPELPSDAVGATAPVWDTSAIPESPPSARVGACGAFGDRPTTRDGGARPGTQDCAHWPSGVEPQWWKEGLDAMLRPTTRDSRNGTADARVQMPLDGMRPSTRDGARLQQMIDGTGGGGHSHSRPRTRDAGRQYSRSERSRDLSARQAAGRRKLHSFQASEAGDAHASPEASASPPLTSRGLPEEGSAELLE